MTEREALTILGAWLKSSERPVRIPSRTVDFAVGIISGFPGFKKEGGSWVWTNDEGKTVPAFSTDFYAAQSLIPGNCKWSLEGDKSHPYCEVAHVWIAANGDEEEQFIERADMDGPVAALCAAATRLRWRLICAGKPIAPEPEWQSGYPGDDVHEMDLENSDDGGVK
jgi:hypothetical protein